MNKKKALLIIHERHAYLFFCVSFFHAAAGIVLNLFLKFKQK